MINTTYICNICKDTFDKGIIPDQIQSQIIEYLRCIAADELIDVKYSITTLIYTFLQYRYIPKYQSDDSFLTNIYNSLGLKLRLDSQATEEVFKMYNMEEVILKCYNKAKEFILQFDNTSLTHDIDKDKDIFDFIFKYFSTLENLKELDHGIIDWCAKNATEEYSKYYYEEK